MADAGLKALIAAAIAAGITRLLISVAHRRSILAVPNARSSHQVPTPTLGGGSIVLVLLGWAAYRIGQDPVCWAVLVGGGILAVVGLVDDLRDLSARMRLPLHAIAAAIALVTTPFAVPLVLPPFVIRPEWIVIALDFLLLLWMVNLYNFMDGIDGYAATQCVGFCAGVLSIGRPAASMEEMLWVLLGAAAGFLWFNRPPARIFMGDVGSGFVGLVIGFASLTLDARRQMPLIASLVLLAGFWFDATWTLCVRIVTRQRFAAAHRSHLYQRSARRWGHGWTTSMFGIYMLVWLFPLAWLCVHVPVWGFAWLALAIAPLAIAAIGLRAGFPDELPEAH